MMFGVLLGAALGVTSPCGTVCDDLWFFADFDSVPRIGGRPFLQKLPDGGEVNGRFGKGYAFVSDEKRCDNRFWSVRDAELLKDFPHACGSFSCWFRSPEKYIELTDSPAFGYCGFWKFQWTWRGATFSTGSTATIKDFARSTEWRHFAATWNDERLVLYLNGEAVAETPKPERIDMTEVPKCALRIGAGFDGSPAANLEMDEIAIFSRDLSAEDVKSLATAEKGLMDGCVSAVAEPVDFPIYWRNQDDAAVRMRLHVTENADVKLAGEIAGEPISPRVVHLVAGLNRLAVPFDPYRFKAGRYPWKVRLETAGGTGVWSGSGELEIRPRLERDAFKMVNWGGWKPIPDTYLKAVGINSSLVDVLDRKQVRRLVEAGFFPNLRYENNGKYKLSSADLDPEKIKELARRDFADYEGLHVWVTTLLNSECYGSSYPQKAVNRPKFMAWARQELGFEPDFNYNNAPIELNAKTVGEWPKGIIARGSCRQLDSLRWVMVRGMTPYRINAFSAEVIHELDPRNIVWSEPAFEGITANLDMLADWHYQYRTSDTLRELRAYYSYCRPYGKPYMPTLSAGYFHGATPTVAPIDGRKKQRGTQSVDEVAIKAWMSLTAVPTRALSFFALDDWSEGEKSGIAEPGTGVRFGQVWRETIAPAADLLRDLPNERAPVALVCLSECRFASGIGWGQVHYPGCIAGCLVKAGVPYDVLMDKELESGALKGYRYAILPMAKTIYADHVAKLEEAEIAGCCIVTDSYAAKTFGKGVSLDKLAHPYDFRKNKHKIDDELLPWIGSVLPGLRENLSAWSDGEGDSAHTFVKELDGVRYVTVVNDRRSDEKGFLNGCVTNDWYRPYGAPQKIVTHVKVPEGAAVYEFNKGDCSIVRLKDCSIESDYPAAQAKVFCVYPKPLARLVADVKDGFVRIALVDADGKLAPGRQVVAVEVRDPDGALHDETGRYVMNGGRVKIPLRLARDDADGTWQVNVKELTTGFAVNVSWGRGKEKGK